MTTPDSAKATEAVMSVIEELREVVEIDTAPEDIVGSLRVLSDAAEFLPSGSTLVDIAHIARKVAKETKGTDVIHLSTVEVETFMDRLLTTAQAGNTLTSEQLWDLYFDLGKRFYPVHEVSK